MKHQFRKKLLNGDRLIGTMVTLKSPEVSELLSQVGFDWLFIDAEHAPFATRDMQTLLQSAGKRLAYLVFRRMQLNLISTKVTP